MVLMFSWVVWHKVPRIITMPLRLGNRFSYWVLKMWTIDHIFVSLPFESFAYPKSGSLIKTLSNHSFSWNVLQLISQCVRYYSKFVSLLIATFHIFVFQLKMIKFLVLQFGFTLVFHRDAFSSVKMLLILTQFWHYFKWKLEHMQTTIVIGQCAILCGNRVVISM